MRRFLLIIFLSTFSITANAQLSIWQQLLRRLQFGDTNRAKLEFECKHNPLYRTRDQLIELCEKRTQIPDHVLEDAALPYLMTHISESMAERALAHVSTDAWQSVGRKLIAEIATGKRDQLNPADIAFLEKENESDVGKALRAFAKDKEQGIAVAKAMLAYY